MKPIKLIISGFGPYGDTMPAIEFDKFADKGLFLISGDTGAGKTTIFDAISFALYGITSGSYKNTKNLRSEYAKTDVESYVDFYFSHQGHQYHVCRKPSYERINRNGKRIEEAEKVIFYYEDGSTVEGTRNVDGTKEDVGVIRELLHIDAKQFKQIAMIAQGEFWDLLNAKTEDRTVILRTIFETEGYKNLEIKLKEKMNDSYGKRMDVERSILQYFCDVTAAEDCECSRELEELQDRARQTKSMWNIDEIVTVIEDVIENDQHLMKEWSEKLDEQEEILAHRNQILTTARTNNKLLQKVKDLKKEKEGLDEKKSDMEQLSFQLKKNKDATYGVNPSYAAWHSKANELHSTKTERDNLLEEVEHAKQEENDAEKSYRKAVAGESENETRKIKVRKMIEDEEQYAVRDELVKAISNLEKEHSLLEKEERLMIEEEDHLKHKINDFKSRIDQINHVPEKYLEVTKEYSKMEDLLNQINKIQKEEIPIYMDKKKLYEESKEHYEKIHKSYIMIREKEQQAKEMIDSCRAGILAQNLKEGMPCPVCGAVHHEKLAKLPDEYITEEQYKKLKEELERERIKNEAGVAQAEGAKKSYEAEREHLKKEIILCVKQDLYGEDFTDNKEIIELINLLQEENVKLQKSFLEVKEREEELKKLSNELNETRMKLEAAQGIEKENLEKKKNLLLEKKNQNRTMLVEKKTDLKAIGELPYQNLKSAVSERQLLEEKISGYETLLENTRKQKEEMAKYYTKQKASLDTLNITMEKQQKEADALYHKYMAALSQREFSSEKEFLSYVVSEDEIKESETMITDFHGNMKMIEGQLESALSDASGKEWIDVDIISEDVKMQNRLVDSLRGEKSRIEFRLTNNEDRLSRIKGKRNALESYQKENNIYSRLYYLVTGQTGKGKITLEQYIQAEGFDHIIAAANRRLLPMTDYQYELYRREDSLGKRSNTFLDLEVLDNFTGSRRPVGNLSGGESFKASLSLALGLSDTVSSNLGGVQMDALFVDEGFGTLDRKSIDSAMDILLNLAGTNKLVGIISHREELMENIPQQIKVTKTKDGSRMAVEGVF